MNEDDIDTLITKLEKDKNEIAKVTLVLAKMYSAKSGKPVKDILDLMKKDTWLTADEAKEWGFVDEVYSPPKVVNYVDDLSIVAMIQANGLPVPHQAGEVKVDEESLFNRLSSRFSEFFKPKNNSGNSMKKQFLNLNKVLKVDKLEASAEGVYLNEEQLESIEQSLAASAQAETARTTAETSLNNAVTALNSVDESVSKAETIENKVSAIKTLLASKPGTKPAGVQGKKDNDPKDDGVDWETLNSLPHMQENN